MLSKFARAACSLRRRSPQAQTLQPGRALSALIRRPAPAALTRGLRARSDLVPPNQYDRPTPKMFNFFHVISNYWETIPLFLVTALAMGLVVAATVWACLNKVDVVFSHFGPNKRNNISRTMHLCNPKAHKVIIIDQRYEDWPELQCVLDKMTEAEKRLNLRSAVCPFAT